MDDNQLDQLYELNKPVQTSKDFLIRINDIYKRIRLEEIYYFSSEGKYVSIAGKDRKYSFRSTLKHLETILPGNFTRIHTSHIINLDKITGVKVQDNSVLLSNGDELPFSRTYKDNIYMNFLVG